MLGASLRKPSFNEENNHSKKSHNAENCQRGFLKIQFVAKYQKNKSVFDTFWRHLKNLDKTSHSAENNWKRAPFSLVRFCKCTKKFLAEAVTRTRDHWVPPKSGATVLCSTVLYTEKWNIKGELCGLTKENGKQDGHV